MRSLIFLLTLFTSSVVLAQTTLYVDPAGSDSNSCTGSGTSACATLSGALAKLAKDVNIATTINVAPGTYNESQPIVEHYRFGANGGLSIVGAMGAHSPSSGSATGAVTTYSSTLGTASAKLSDSGQAWGVDELRGRTLTMTSGSANGQRRLIASNTATSVTLVQGFSVSPTGGDTYELQTPVSVFTNGMLIYNVIGRQLSTAGLHLKQLAVSRQTGQTLMALSTNSLALTDVRIVGTASATMGLALRDCSSSGQFVNLSNVYIESPQTAFSALNTRTVNTAVGVGALGTGTMVYSTGTGGSGTATYLSDSSLFGAFWSQTGRSNASALMLAGNSRWSASTSTVSVLKCAGGVWSRGVNLTGGDPTTHPAPNDGNSGARYVIAGVANAQLRIEGCAGAVAATLPGTVFDWNNGAVKVVDATTGFEALRGGKILLTGFTPAFENVTYELNVEGANYSFDYLNTLSPAVITSLYSSSIWH